MEFVFSIFRLKTFTLSTAFFRFLGNILQHSSLNSCFYEDSDSKTPSVLSLIFTGCYRIYGDMSVKTLQLGQLQDENMRTINFILN